MKTMFDSSVLVPALLTRHPDHARSVDWLKRAQTREFPSFIAAHSLAECYATLTAKTPLLNVAPALVAESMRIALLAHHPTLIELSASDYVNSIENVASRGLSSGIIYDALLIAAAQKAKIERLFTFNLKHFLQILAPGQYHITSP